MTKPKLFMHTKNPIQKSSIQNRNNKSWSCTSFHRRKMAPLIHTEIREKPKWLEPSFLFFVIVYKYLIYTFDKDCRMFDIFNWILKAKQAYLFETLCEYFVQWIESGNRVFNGASGNGQIGQNRCIHKAKWLTQGFVNISTTSITREWFVLILFGSLVAFS